MSNSDMIETSDKEDDFRKKKHNKAEAGSSTKNILFFFENNTKNILKTQTNHLSHISTGV